MNSPTIEMERATAQTKLYQYEQAARSNPKHTRTLDKGITEGYRVLARGGRLVDVNEAMRHGGLNLAGQPKLAIARAHVERVRWLPNLQSVWDGGKIVGYTTTGGGEFNYRENRHQRINDDRLRWVVAEDTFSRLRVQERREFLAMVPLVPLPLRPKRDLCNYFVLWEANWHSVPTDPYLLKPLAGSLMEIVAEWDLTPLEVAAVRNSLTTR